MRKGMYRFVHLCRNPIVEGYRSKSEETQYRSKKPNGSVQALKINQLSSVQALVCEKKDAFLSFTRSSKGISAGYP